MWLVLPPMDLLFAISAKIHLFFLQITLVVNVLITSITVLIVHHNHFAHYVKIFIWPKLMDPAPTCALFGSTFVHNAHLSLSVLHALLINMPLTLQQSEIFVKAVIISVTTAQTA